MSKTVVCYSRSGKTLRAADELAKELGAKLIEVKEAEPRDGFFGFMRCGMYATFKWPSKILPLEMPAEKPSLTVICGPIWAGKMSAPIRAFLLKNKERLGDVAYILTRGDQKNEYLGAMDEMDSMLGKKRKGGLSLAADLPPATVTSRVKSFADSLR
jgi:hypothetical protein